MLFDRSSPPPFYQAKLTPEQRTALDRLFIGKRSQAHYLKRFASFDQAQRIGARWHWAAFLMTLPWMLYRRRFLDGLVYAVVGWSFIHLVITIILVIIENTLLPFLADVWHWPIRLGVAGSIWLGWSALTAMWADAYYYRVARREISESIEDRLPSHEQAALLQREGGTSWQGLLLSFGLFGFVLATIQTVYLPMYATYLQRNLLLDVYDLAATGRDRVQVIMDNSGQCPVGLFLSTQDQSDRLARLQVLDHAAGVPMQSDCIVQATLQGARWPVAKLNGEHLTLYHLSATTDRPARWPCMTSISQRESPKGCLLD